MYSDESVGSADTGPTIEGPSTLHDTTVSIRQLYAADFALSFAFCRAFGDIWSVLMQYSFRLLRSRRTVNPIV